jgi:hypothetical protein
LRNALTGEKTPEPVLAPSLLDQFSPPKNVKLKLQT